MNERKKVENLEFGYSWCREEVTAIVVVDIEGLVIQRFELGIRDANTQLPKTRLVGAGAFHRLHESKLKIARCGMSPRNEKGDSSMGLEKPHPLQIELQLTETLWRRAEESALSEGISLQDFILYAIGEKIASSEPPD